MTYFKSCAAVTKYKTRICYWHNRVVLCCRHFINDKTAFQPNQQQILVNDSASVVMSILESAYLVPLYCQ